MELSVVISLYNEEESLRELVAWIHEALAGKVSDYEIIMVDDGSKDGSWDVISSMAAGLPKTRERPAIAARLPLHSTP